MILTVNSDYFLKQLHHLIFVMETRCVFFAVGFELFRRSSTSKGKVDYLKSIVSENIFHSCGFKTCHRPNVTLHVTSSRH
jgi:hypothetical protein